jgi:hypothetical protein
MGGIMPIGSFVKDLFSGGAGKIIDSVKGVISEFHMSPEDKIKAEQAAIDAVNKHIESMEQELTKQMESEDKAITERWKYDMESDSWLSKNTRPLVMLSLLAFLFIIIIFDSSIKDKFEVKDSYVTLMETLLVTVTIAYFGSRGVEKFKTIHESRKKK